MSAQDVLTHPTNKSISRRVNTASLSSTTSKEDTFSRNMISSKSRDITCADHPFIPYSLFSYVQPLPSQWLPSSSPTSSSGTPTPSAPSRPMVLVGHDMAGGYTQDDIAQGPNRS